MPLSKIQIALYSLLAAGVFAGLAFKVPYTLLIAFAVVVGVADCLLGRRRQANEDPTEGVVALRWPWQRPAFWIVLASFAALAGALAHMGAPIGTIALICGLGLMFYAYSVALEIESKIQQRRGRIRLGPGVEAWTLLGVSLVFFAGGLLILTNDWRIGVVTLTFGGACALTFGSNIRRKLRERRWAGATVRVVGCVNIYADGTRMGFIASGCLVVGAVMYFVGTSYPLLFRLIGAFIALVGAVVAIMVALGMYSRQFIRFEPDGVILGERHFRSRIAWDNILAVLTFDYADNPFVGLQLANLDEVRVEPKIMTSRFLRQVAQNRALFRADMCIAPQIFGIDGLVLAEAVRRYTSEPDARAELAGTGQTNAAIRRIPR